MRRIEEKMGRNPFAQISMVVIASLLFSACSGTAIKTVEERMVAGEKPEKTLNARLRETVEYLASKELQGRAPGTPGHERAKEFIIQRMRELGAQIGIQKGRGKIPWKPEFENLITRFSRPQAPWKAESAKHDCVAFVAHYDHNPPMDGRYSPGANDNASGVAALIELARDLSTKNLPDGVDWYFIFPDEEENFISGSPSVVGSLRAKCQNILFSVTLDLVGAPFFPGFENHLLALGAESSPELERLLVDGAQKVPELKVLGDQIFLIEPLGIARSDYDAFRKAEIPYVFLTTGIPANYHTPEDTIERLDFALLENVTRYLVSVADRYVAQGASRGFSWVSDDADALRSDEEYLYQGIRVAYLMDRMASKPKENKLEADDVEWLRSAATELRDANDPPSRLGLQLKIIKVLKFVSRRSPVENAYLKSFLLKVF